jgi:hypothetical protein
MKGADTALSYALVGSREVCMQWTLNLLFRRERKEKVFISVLKPPD